MSIALCIWQLLLCSLVHGCGAGTLDLATDTADVCVCVLTT